MQQPDGSDGNEAFGFSDESAPRQEKYNTRYLVMNMKKDRRRTVLWALAGAVVAAIGVALIVTLAPQPQPVAKPQASATAEPAVQAPSEAEPAASATKTGADSTAKADAEQR